MIKRDIDWKALICTVILATLFWFVTFFITLGNFWIKISLSASILAGLSMLLTQDKKRLFNFHKRDIITGLCSASVLYFIFWAGKIISNFLFPFADKQIAGIYAKGEGTPLWAVALLLIFITGPSEELYWRGYLQHQLMKGLGKWQGFIIATALYAGVHLWTLNFMLVGAAAVAGAFWGLMYLKFNNLSSIIISHSVWSAIIFAVIPLS